MRSIGRIAYLKDRARSWSRVIQSRPWRYSAGVRLAWRLYRANFRAELYKEYSILHELKYSDWNFGACGPAQEFASDADRFEHCAEIWTRSSLQLSHLCAANRVRYYHFLQPNQYFSGSKSMGGRKDPKHGCPHIPAGSPSRQATRFWSVRGAASQTRESHSQI
jgi:hypothetical protein